MSLSFFRLLNFYIYIHASASIYKEANEKNKPACLFGSTSFDVRFFIYIFLFVVVVVVDGNNNNSNKYLEYPLFSRSLLLFVCFVRLNAHLLTFCATVIVVVVFEIFTKFIHSYGCLSLYVFVLLLNYFLLFSPFCYLVQYFSIHNSRTFNECHTLFFSHKLFLHI